MIDAKYEVQNSKFIKKINILKERSNEFHNNYTKSFNTKLLNDINYQKFRAFYITKITEVK